MPIEGLSLPFDSGDSRSSMWLSPMPTVFSTRVTSTSPPAISRSRGETSFSHMRYISCGTPGIAMM